MAIEEATAKKMIELSKELADKIIDDDRVGIIPTANKVNEYLDRVEWAMDEESWPVCKFCGNKTKPGGKVYMVSLCNVAGIDDTDYDIGYVETAYEDQGDNTIPSEEILICGTCAANKLNLQNAREN